MAQLGWKVRKIAWKVRKIAIRNFGLPEGKLLGEPPLLGHALIDGWGGIFHGLQWGKFSKSLRKYSE